MPYSVIIRTFSRGGGPSAYFPGGLGGKRSGSVSSVKGSERSRRRAQRNTAAAAHRKLSTSREVPERVYAPPIALERAARAGALPDGAIERGRMPNIQRSTGMGRTTTW